MNKLNVIFNGWGQRWCLGTLADTGRSVLFEYSSQAVARGWQMSPLHQPLPLHGATSAAFTGDVAFWGLPGFIADALPDGWGMLLMDRCLHRAGRDPRSVSVLDRLAMVGDRAMGALSFEPAQDAAALEEILQLQTLAEEIVRLQTMSDDTGQGSTTLTDEKLHQLLRLGGSPQGARPKVLLNFDLARGVFGSGATCPSGAAPWLIKFPAVRENLEVSALEELYARVARHGGIHMPQSRFFDLGAQHSAFGVERFDRVAAPLSMEEKFWRVPLLSLSALLQADFRTPALDYETVLLATQRLTGDRREVLKAFERCVFNVLMHNRDDHGRNFAFLMDAQGLWKLAPAFDLTFSDGPGGEHATSVAGVGTNIMRNHLLKVAKLGGIETRQANACIDRWVGVVRSLADHAGDLPIRQSTRKKVLQITSGLCKAMD